MNKKNLMVLDWSNLMYRSLYMTKLFNSPDSHFETKEEINSFVAKLTTDIVYLLKIFQAYNIIFAVDSKHPWRKDILKDEIGYKSNRKKDNIYNWDNIFKASNDLLTIFKRKYHINIAKVDNGEADDICALIKEVIFENYKDWNIIIVSADADLRQLIDFNKETKQYCIVYNTISIGKNSKRKLYVNKDFLDWYNKPNIADIFFSNIDYSKEYIASILSKNSVIQLVEEDGNDVVLSKIFCGDDGDCVPSFYEYYKNGKKQRVTPGKYKKLKEELQFNTVNDLLLKKSLIKESLSSIMKKEINDIDCSERLERQEKLVELNSNLFPESIKEYKKEISKMIDISLNIDYSLFNSYKVLKNTKYEEVFQEKAKDAIIFKELDKYVNSTSQLFS